MIAVIAATGMFVSLHTKPFNRPLFNGFFAVGMVACFILVLNIIRQLMENLSR